MSEAKVNWHYTCPICKERFEYSFAAGSAEQLCKRCDKLYDHAHRLWDETFERTRKDNEPIIAWERFRDWLMKGGLTEK